MTCRRAQSIVALECKHVQPPLRYSFWLTTCACTQKHGDCANGLCDPMQHRRPGACVAGWMKIRGLIGHTGQHQLYQKAFVMLYASTC